MLLKHRQDSNSLRMARCFIVMLCTNSIRVA